MENMVYDHKVDTRHEASQRIFDAARRITDTAAQRKFIISIFIRVRMCLQAAVVILNIY